jgi:flagellar hook-length control protein FliK
MMQNVATAKSGIAAFATGAESDSFAESGANEQFGKLLNDQEPNNSSVVASEGPPPHSPRKKALQQSLDELEKPPSSDVKDQKSTQTKNTSNEQTVTTGASQHKIALQPSAQGNVSDQPVVDHAEANVDDISEGVANNLNDELKVDNTDTVLILLQNQNDIESELPIESESVVAQEWVTLVDNLQKLAGISRLTKTPSVEDESKSLDVAVADVVLFNKVDVDLVEHDAEQQIVDGFIAASDISGLQQTGFVATENVNNKDLIPAVAKEEKQSGLTIIIQQALEQLTAKSETGEVPSADTPQNTAELLLEQPAVLQNLFSQLQNLSQKNATDNGDQKTIETTIGKVVEKDLLLTNQKIQTGEQLDLSLAENKTLLRALLVDSETDKIPAQEIVKLVKPEVSDASGKPMQALEVETLITKLENVAEQGELLEQDVQLTQVAPSNNLNSSKPEKVVSNLDIKNILNLSDNKLDKALENIAQRVFDNNKAAVSISPEQIAQQVVMPRTAEIVSSIESSSKEFVAALKSGLEEFKNQLAKGREPGIDLKTMVSDVLAKITDTAVAAKSTGNLEQIVSSVSQVLDFAQTLNRTITDRHDQAFSATARDAAQIQGEQSKQIQLNQFESKFEKAINIAKPEGHQQLAEKVRWMVNTRNLVAEIRLDPAELGSVHVKVAMSGESATINFVVQSQQARDALDSATPRLREMLAEKGVELGQSSVRQESDGQQGQNNGDLAKQGGKGKEGAEEIEVPEQMLAQQNIINGALGGIDYFV